MTVSGAVALLCAVWSVCSISLLAPGIAPRHLTVGTASTDLIVDAPQSWILDARKNTADFNLLTQHADLAGNLVSSTPARQLIARRAGIPADELAARTRLTGSFESVLREPGYEQRASQILDARKEYGIDVQIDPKRPIIHVYTQAPSVAAAVNLANAVPSGLRRFVQKLRASDANSDSVKLQLRQLGPARGAVANSGASLQIAFLTFLVMFAVSFALLTLVGRVRAGWASAAGQRTAPQPSIAPMAGRLDDWPRTPRVLPWLVAMFLGLIWLVPFNTIQLQGSLPFDLKLDRLFLPVLVLVWVLSIAAGVRDARRPHLTAVHVGVGVFLAAAFLSVVLNAHSLNQALEFDAASKKMVLLASYGCFFLVISSVVRRSEVPAFLVLTLGLAVACALGTIAEYRFHYNVFYDLSSKLLPSTIFSAVPLDSSAVDEIGRRLSRGPGEHPLETTAMLAMALPIALVGVMKAKGRPPWKTFLYACAVCIIFAAAISTYRKSALLAPLSAVLTIAYFRRAALVRLVPLGVVAAIAVHVLSPGAFGAITGQLRPDRLGVGTVTDRASDYDALRPDVWTHLFIGRGFGSYDHTTYRILDSEILGLLVGVGVIGLVCYLLMLGTIVFAARRPIRSHDTVASDAGLAIAAGTVAFAVVSFLFDALEFPHAPYIMLSLAGLLAVVLMPKEAEAEAEAGPSRLSTWLGLREPEPEPGEWAGVPLSDVRVPANVER